jgi:K+-sensing histidine kinase KdpD
MVPPFCRVESDAVMVEGEWVQASDIVDAAARQVEALLAAHPLEVDLGNERPLISIGGACIAATRRSG